MSSRFTTQQGPVRPSEADIVSALVSVLSDGGIARSRIDAIINKAARPAADHDNTNRRPVGSEATSSVANSKVSLASR